MTDRELLELAAKATGFANWSYVGGTSGICVELGSRPGAVTSYWNPLRVDGDAFRLAVKLELDVMCGSVRTDDLSVQMPIQAGTEIYAATRRAIVCAAAEIGRAMP